MAVVFLSIKKHFARYLMALSTQSG